MNMTDFTRLLQAKKKELDLLMRQRLPIMVGRMAKDHYQDNFRRQGFSNGGLHAWPKTRRQLSGGSSAVSQYGALLSGRNHLFSSISYAPGDARVTVYNHLPYAPLHNWGGNVRPHVTPQMRRFAWAKFFESGGNKKDPLPEAQKWRALALTRKKQLNIRIPQRQFIGKSQELNQKIQQIIDKETIKTLNL